MAHRNICWGVKIAAQSTAVDVTANDGKALKPGIYLLKASSPETAALGNQPTGHFMMVATANLTMKYSVDKVLVWATDAQTGSPIANAGITLYDKISNR